MLRTMWFALACLAALGTTMTIRAAMTPAPVVVAAVPAPTTVGQVATDIAFGPNSAAKSDRLPIPEAHEPAETDPAPAVAMTAPADAPANGPATTNKDTSKEIDATPRKAVEPPPRKTAHRRWQDSNARLIAGLPSRRHARARPEKTDTDNGHGQTTSNVLRCRQDALGGLLRSLDLSPHCSS